MGSIFTVGIAYLNLSDVMDKDIATWAGQWNLRLSFGLALATVWPAMVVSSYSQSQERSHRPAVTVTGLLLGLAGLPLAARLWGDWTLMAWGGLYVLVGLMMSLMVRLESIWGVPPFQQIRFKVQSDKRVLKVTSANLLRVLTVVTLFMGSMLLLMCAMAPTVLPLRIKLGVPMDERSRIVLASVLGPMAAMHLWNRLRHAFERRRPVLRAAVYAGACTLIAGLWIAVVLDLKEGWWAAPFVGLVCGWMLFLAQDDPGADKAKRSG